MSHYFDRVADQWDTCSMKVDRAKITAAKIKALNFNHYTKCVDFGSGTGLLGMQLSECFSSVHLADASEEMLKVAREKLSAANIPNVKTQQVSALSDLSEHYSAIVTLMTLHHLNDITGFFTDAYQRLESQGRLVIADLFSEDGSFHKHNLSFTGHNGFDPDFLVDIAESVGFKVDSVDAYYSVWQENFAGERVAYPLFMLVATKGVTKLA